MQPNEGELVEPKVEEPNLSTTCFLDVTGQNSSPVEVFSQDTTLTVLESQSIHIKEEQLDNVFSESSNHGCSESALSVPNLDHGFSESTVAVSNRTLSCDHVQQLKSLEKTICETIEVNKQLEIVELKQIVEKTNLLDKCIEELTSYRKYLTESILNFHSGINNSLREKNSLPNASKLTTGDFENEEQVSKRQKLDVADETIIKSEPEEEGNNLVFSPIEDKITTMEVIKIIS